MQYLSYAVASTKQAIEVMQVLLRWNVQHDISVIPKSTKEERIEENAGLWDWELSAEDFETLSTLKTQVVLPILTCLSPASARLRCHKT